MITHLPKKYKQVIPEMKKRFGYDNEMAVPKIEKVVVNTSFGKLLAEEKSNKEKVKQQILEQLSLITGQRPILTRAKKSISGFDLSQGEAIGAKATLRGNRMYDFLERLTHITLPRSRDFKGIPQESVDEHGNLTIPIKEHIAFPEILPEEAEHILGLEVTVVTDTESREEALELFKLLEFPIKGTKYK